MDKTLVVTGASSDMGTYLIKKQIDNYKYIIVHYRNMNEKLKTVIAKAKTEIIELKCDFSNENEYESIENRLKEITESIKGTEIHFVHFPAPQCNNNRFHKIKWEVFQKEIDISIRSFVVVSQVLIPLMIKANKGKIVMMLSYLVENIPSKYCANYITVKYAMLGMMKALAVEYAEKGITVNGVSPASVDTKYISNQPEVLLNGWIDKSPIKRNMRIDEVVPAIEFLLSEGANCVNGENIMISCGMGAH